MDTVRFVLFPTEKVTRCSSVCVSSTLPENCRQVAMVSDFCGFTLTLPIRCEQLHQLAVDSGWRMACRFLPRLK